MSDKFVASNGLHVWIDGRGDVRTTQGFSELPPEEVTAALREFFQKERDEELGRWRWPENPNYVAYPKAEDAAARVVNESSAKSETFRRFEQGLSEGTMMEKAAAAYFAAHPEPKPWETAKPNEVWIFKGKGGEPHPFTRPPHGLGWISPSGLQVAHKPGYDGRPYGDAHDPNFEPYRIWPQS